MANKTQAKAAIDSVVALIKSDIDTILPTGVNIRDGRIMFSPNGWVIVLSAADVTEALSWLSSIESNLTAAGRAFTEDRLGRVKLFTILAGPSTFRITYL